MVVALRLFFLVVLASMFGVTGWASSLCPLFGVPREVATHPWFIATLFDAYWGFLTFYLWVAWREKSWLGRISWLIAILLLGNIAMAAYCLERLFQVTPSASFAEIIAVRRDRPSWLGPILTVLAGVIIYTLA